jgi:CRISPR-associated exonuclease Cas4
VQFDPPLRDRTEAAAVRLHRMIADGVTPLAVRQPKCDSCSLLELCMPDAMRPRRAAGAWVRAALARAVEPASGEESPR